MTTKDISDTKGKFDTTRDQFINSGCYKFMIHSSIIILQLSQIPRTVIFQQGWYIRDMYERDCEYCSGRRDNRIQSRRLPRPGCSSTLPHEHGIPSCRGPWQSSEFRFCSTQSLVVHGAWRRFLSPTIRSGSEWWVLLAAAIWSAISLVQVNESATYELRTVSDMTNDLFGRYLGYYSNHRLSHVDWIRCRFVCGSGKVGLKIADAVEQLSWRRNMSKYNFAPHFLIRSIANMNTTDLVQWDQIFPTRRMAIAADNDLSDFRLKAISCPRVSP